MVVRAIIVALLALLLGACSHFHKPTPEPVLTPPVNKISQFRQVSSFSNLRIGGNFDVTIHTGYAKPQVLLQGDSRDLVYVETKNADNTLKISLMKGYPRFGSIHLDIRTNQLKTFAYSGKGTIIGKKLHTQGLNLLLDNAGNTTLQGQLNLATLDVRGGGVSEISSVTGSKLTIKVAGKSRIKLGGIVNVTCINLRDDSYISMYWVKSRALVIRARDKSFAQLAGIVNRLDVELWGNAHFHGRYLRAKRAFVKTHNNAIAEMSAVSHQHTLATDASEIRFYNLPTMRADFMALDGAVLDMRNLGDPLLQETTDFNKFSNS